MNYPPLFGNDDFNGAEREHSEHSILVVDDEELIREELIGYLSDKGYLCLSAPNASEAIELVRWNAGVSIILSDIRMPGPDGLDLLASAKSEPDRDIAVIMLTGHGGKHEAIKALRLGAEDFLEKPIDLHHLLHVIQRAEELVNLRQSQRLFEKGLQAKVAAKTAEVRRLVRGLEVAYQEALESLAIAAEYKDTVTGNHIRRVSKYAELMATRLGWGTRRLQIIGLAVSLHDIGKIGIPDAVLQKSGTFNTKEVSKMRLHPEIGHRILSGSNDPVMICAASIALSHHERWDGSGYPQGLKGAEAPIEARIASIVDVYDALRSPRPYKPGLDHGSAVSIMLEGDGRTMPGHFDPKLLEFLNENHGEFEKIFDSLAG
jgi:putative two-component system response regulator